MIFASTSTTRWCGSIRPWCGSCRCCATRSPTATTFNASRPATIHRTPCKSIPDRPDRRSLLFFQCSLFGLCLSSPCSCLDRVVWEVTATKMPWISRDLVRLKTRHKTTDDVISGTIETTMIIQPSLRSSSICVYDDLTSTDKIIRFILFFGCR